MKGWALLAQYPQAFTSRRLPHRASHATPYTTSRGPEVYLLMVAPQPFLGVSPALERGKEHRLLFGPAGALRCLRDNPGCCAAKRCACALTAPGYASAATTWWPVGARVVLCCGPAAAALMCFLKNCSSNTCYAAWQQV